MGRATRWFKGLFGVKPTQKDPKFFTNSNSGRHSMDPGVLCNNPATIPPNITPAEAAWLKSYYSESGDQSKHAIAVATATAAAADAAVAAAQAAVAVVRLTSRGRGSVFSASCGNGGAEKWAAVKIQTNFRGFLARKALRALRGLVKIQALVRGYLVRKQAKATLHGMQALIRAQATVRSKRLLLLQPHTRIRTHTHIHNTSHSEFFRARKSLEIFDGSKGEQEAALHSRRLSASFESRTISPIIEDIPKIVEVDPGRPGTYEPDPFYTPRLSIPRWPNTDQWGHMGRECGSSSAQSTPRFTYPGPGPGTPSRSVCGDRESNNNIRHYKNYQNGHPNYMCKTESFRAKVRSQSTPKQRAEEEGPKKMMESRNSLSGGKMQMLCSQAQEAINFKNVVMGKLEKSYEFARDPNRYNLCSKN